MITENKPAIVLDCVHADTCLPDYWGGHHLPHLVIPVYRNMTLREVKEALRSEINQDAIAGSVPSDGLSDEWYRAAQQAIDEIALKDGTAPDNHKLFGDLEETDDADFGVYAFFVFVGKEC